MPMYDLKCDECGGTEIDVLEPIAAAPHTCECGGTLRRAWLTRTPAVISDSIRGGIEIRNGLCDENGKPVRYDSKSEIKRAAKAKGLQNVTEHIGDVEHGSDKAPSVGGGKTTTSRWY